MQEIKKYFSLKKQIACIVIFIIIPVLNSFGQNNTIPIQKRDRIFSEEYSVLKNDSSIKQGVYIRRYHDYVVEKGMYQNGKKYGEWVYFSLDGTFDYAYDYTSKKITKIAQKHKSEDYLRTPVFFDGSPIVPYLYLVSHVVYPQEAKDKNIHGKITLTLYISEKGHITALSLSKKLNPILDKEVLRAAKTFPLDWKWIPATNQGHNVSGKYNIDIEFQLVDE